MLRYLLLIILLATSFVSFADDDEYPDTWDTGSGYYLGVNVGYINTHSKQRGSYRDIPDVQQAFGQRVWGLGGRAFIGYLVNPNLGVETGYTYVPLTKANLKSFSTGAISSVSTKQFALDFLFVVKIPFEKHFDAYVKGGMAYIEAEESLQGTSEKSNASTYRPAFAIGWDWRVTDNVTINLEWYRMTGKANAFDGPEQDLQRLYGYSHLALPMTDIFQGGLSYRF